MLGIWASELAIIKDNSYVDPLWPVLPYDTSTSGSSSKAIKKMLNGLQTEIRAKADDKVQAEAIGLSPGAYEVLKKAIEFWGYKLNLDFWLFAYDWRQSNIASGELLARFIRDRLNEGNWDSVDIITQSMGGIAAGAAVFKHGAPIKSTVYIASPHFGCPLAYFSLHPDITSQGFIRFFDKADSNASWNIHINEMARLHNRSEDLFEQSRAVHRKFPSMYDLLPDDFYLDGKPMLFSNNIANFGTKEIYLENEWIFKIAKMRTAARKALEFKKQLGHKLRQNDEDDDDDILIVAGSRMKTPDVIRYRTNSSRFDGPYDSGKQATRRWVSLQDKRNSLNFRDSVIQEFKTYSWRHAFIACRRSCNNKAGQTILQSLRLSRKAAAHISQ